MPAELFPLAAALSGGRLVPEILIALTINIGGTIACVAGLRWALKDNDSVPPSITAWPWEPEAWGFPPREAASETAKGEPETEGQHPPLPGADTPTPDAAPDAAPPTPHPGVAQKEE